MANHFHLIYTPKGLAEISRDVFTSYEQYICCAEIGQNGLHFHMYIVTNLTQDAVSDKLKYVQKIPPGGKGKKSLHYSNRAIALHPKEYPDQDLRKFTLGYILKQENRKYMKGFTEEELAEALAYYNGQKEENANIKRAQIAPGMFPAVGLEQREVKQKDSVQDEWLEYSIAMMKGITELTHVDIGYFHKKSWNYWKKRNNGLFPVMATQKRFKQSLWALYLDKVGREVDVEDLKEKSLL